MDRATTQTGVRKIQFTQYLLPDGRKTTTWFESSDAPAEVFDMADALILNGFEFESEMLRTGEVSFSCGKDEEVLSMAVCNNGPEVIETVCELVRDAHRRMHIQSRD